LNYGSSGNGSPQHLGAAMLQSLAGIQMHHIPYKGAAPAINDLLPGRIQVWVGAANSTLPHIKDGKLRLLASAGSQRNPSLPDVPTVAEAGVPGFALDVSAGLTMPAKALPAIVARVNADVARLLNTPEVKARLLPQGIEVATNSPAEYEKTVRIEHAIWGKIIRAAGIKAE
jgi:tripartite-type tricarboxylate transporter receptor subunit TctC